MDSADVVRVVVDWAAAFAQAAVAGWETEERLKE